MAEAHITSLHWSPNNSDGYFHIKGCIHWDLQLGTKFMLKFAFLWTKFSFCTNVREKLKKIIHNIHNFRLLEHMLKA